MEKEASANEARMKRDDAPGKFCGIDSQPIRSGGSEGQQTPTQLRQTPETNAQKPETDDVKMNSPYKPEKGGTMPSNWVEFDQDLKNGITTMGQSEEQMCSRASNAQKNIPVCYIGYPPLPRDAIMILPQVRAGKLTSFFSPLKYAHLFHHYKITYMQIRITQSNLHGDLSSFDNRSLWQCPG